MMIRSMISDFIEEFGGFLGFTDEQYREFTTENPGVNLPQRARIRLEYGQNRDGYWRAPAFLAQVKTAVAIAEAKYPRATHDIVFVFDHSSNHAARSADALVANAMNVSVGGKQPKMRDTVWNGQPQKMVCDDGQPKGLRMVLEERGVNVAGKLRDKLVAILKEHDDFKAEKSMVERFIFSRGHDCLFLPKYHFELNPIERVWRRAKDEARKTCRYNIASLRSSIDSALDTVSVDLFRKFFRKTRELVQAYVDGNTCYTVDSAAKTYKSHRRVFGKI